MGERVLLAKTWEGQDLTGWWISEKLDGVRAYWDGEKFISRLGNVFNAPAWFKEGMPRIQLDGELWAGRGRFQDVVGYVKKLSPIDNEWQQVAYVVFDIPDLDLPFEDRMEVLGCLESDGPLVILPQEKCEGSEWLVEKMESIIQLGGEGLMARAPGSRYERKRSSTLLKIKQFKDSEATVVGHQPGTGKYVGYMGALEMVWDNGTRFKIGTGFSDAQRAKPPEIGARVTFRYQELSRDGVPRFPSFVGVRNYE